MAEVVKLKQQLDGKIFENQQLKQKINELPYPIELAETKENLETSMAGVVKPNQQLAGKIVENRQFQPKNNELPNPLKKTEARPNSKTSMTEFVRPKQSPITSTSNVNKLKDGLNQINNKQLERAIEHFQNEHFFFHCDTKIYFVSQL